MEWIRECGNKIRDSVLYDIAVGLCGANSVLPSIYKQGVLSVNGKTSQKRMCFNRGEEKRKRLENGILEKITAGSIFC